MRLPACLLLLACASLAEEPLRKPLISSDLGGRELGFLKKANEQGVLMLYLIESAKTKGTGEKVKGLGSLLSGTQGKENDQLLQLAANKGVSFPAQTPPTLKKLQAKLEPLEGATFDERWLSEAATLAKAIVGIYEDGAKSADADIRAYAEQGVAFARQKLGLVEKLAAK
jgi:predicted outer membrane protein